MKNPYEIPNATANLEIRSRLASSDVFFSRLLHDLTQSLNVIRFIAQDVRLDIRKDRLEISSLPESMKEVETSIDKLVYCFDKLRLFVKSKNGEDVVEFVNPNDLCMAAVQRGKFIESDVEVVESYVDNPSRISVNSFLFRQAVSEILDNARNAAIMVNSGGPQITVVTSIREREFILRIQDNGPGVDADIEEKIFEPFFSTRPDAAGLGLPLSQALISKCFGKLQLVDSDSNGSVFEISIPYDKTPHEG